LISRNRSLAAWVVKHRASGGFTASISASPMTAFGRLSPVTPLFPVSTYSVEKLGCCKIAIFPMTQIAAENQP